MRGVAGAFAAAAVVMTLGGCGAGSQSPAAAASASGAPGGGLTAEDMRASDSEVFAGLNLLKTVVNDVANSAGSDAEAAADAQGRVEPIWSSIEGTVKADEPDTYRIFEEQFAIIQKALDPANPVKERAAADAVVKAADGYLARHPAGVGASTAGPAGENQTGPDTEGPGVGQGAAEPTGSPVPRGAGY